MCNSVKGFNGKDRSSGQDDSRTPTETGNSSNGNRGTEEWKRTIQENFALWLEEVSSLESVRGPSEQESPDLESFFKELSVLRSEFRKGARRSHETFVRFGETLANFERITRSILSRMSAVEKQGEKEDILSKKRIYLPLVEIFERFKRMEDRVLETRGAGFFPFRSMRNNAWRRLREGFQILRFHFEELLKNEGIEIIDTVGKPFDPTLMTAVDAEETGSVKPCTVIEEFSSGYLYRGYPLKLAKVKVAKSKGE